MVEICPLEDLNIQAALLSVALLNHSREMGLNEVP
jgi:hypothetical protein